MSPRRLPKLRPLSRREIVAAAVDECVALHTSAMAAEDSSTASAALRIRDGILARVMESADG